MMKSEEKQSESNSPRLCRETDVAPHPAAASLANRSPFDPPAKPGAIPTLHPRRLITQVILLLALCLTTAACSVKTPYPARDLYTLSAGTPDPADIATPAARKNIILRVRRLITIAPFNTTLFTYRTAPNTITTDYYHAFAAAPADLLTSSLIDFLRATNQFTAVTDNNSGGEHQWALEGRIQELVIDTTTGKPQAVLTLQIMIWDEATPGTHLLLDKTYTEHTTIQSADAPSAVTGWCTDCHVLFTHIAHDLSLLPR